MNGGSDYILKVENPWYSWLRLRSASTTTLSQHDYAQPARLRSASSTTLSQRDYVQPARLRSASATTLSQRDYT